MTSTRPVTAQRHRGFSSKPAWTDQGEGQGGGKIARSVSSSSRELFGASLLPNFLTIRALPPRIFNEFYPGGDDELPGRTFCLIALRFSRF
jgi:hypothetical protein